MLSVFWNWWREGGTNAAAVQQLFFIVLTSIATIVALINLNTWKRQLRAGARAAAAKDVIDAAAHLCDLILIERITHSPMVVFKNLEGFGREWLDKAEKSIEREVNYWELQTQEISKRLAALRISIQRNEHTIGSLGTSEKELEQQATTFQKAIHERVTLITGCRESSDKAEYQKLVSLASLSKRHPFLWRKEKNAASMKFEEAVRRSLDNLRTVLKKV